MPGKLEAVVLRCLEKKPEQRFPDAPELMRALDACDDVPAWTQADAAGWWARRRPLEVKAAEETPSSLKTLTVNVSGRALTAASG